MMRALVAIAFLITLVSSLPARAYEPSTHAILSARAASDSVLTSILPDYGLGSLNDLFPSFTDGGLRLTVLGLIEEGARQEDTLATLRPINHFYNPRTGNGLSLPLAMSSPAWALAARDSSSSQNRSYWDARQYLFDALTKQSKTDRDESFGRAFQTLGHVIHHLQDMAQPQHVRNEMHCDTWVCQLVQPLFGTPSRYERHAQRRETDLPSTRYDVSGQAFTSIVNSPRRFWHTLPPGPDTPQAGGGLAEFTQSNFVSAGTNFLPTSSGTLLPRPEFPLPVPSTPAITEKVDIQSLIPGTSLRGQVWFIGSNVRDNITGQPPILNSRASTFSIFTEDLQGISGRPTVRLNRFNFDSALEHLIPRAVGYSTGMINYFFRGKIDLKKDEQDSSKFRIVNLGPETMNGKFALYYDAIDGNRHRVLVDPAEPNRHPSDPYAYRLVIAALDPAVPNSNLSEAISIIPPVNDGSPLSPKAANEYMLVFNGGMGEERADTGMIGAVAAKMVAAPYNGVLYLLGADAQNQRIALRVDKTGTHVVPGNEFHPLRGITIPPHYQALDKAYSHKQATFTQHTFGWSYDIQAVTTGIHFPFYGAFTTGWLKNSATGAFEISGGPTWKAKSPDPLIGEFRFRPQIPESNWSTGQLEYRRTWVDAGGVTQTQTGFVPLPPHPSPGTNYGVLLVGQAYISPDGTRVTGFYSNSHTPGNPAFHTQHDYDLSITLAPVPALSFVPTGSRQIDNNVRQLIPDNTTKVGELSITWPCGNPVVLTGDLLKTQYLNRTDTWLDLLYYIGYLNGELQTYRQFDSGFRLASFDMTSGSVGGQGPGGCSLVKVRNIGQSTNMSQSDGGWYFRQGSFTNVFRSNDSQVPHPQGILNRTWVLDYEGPVPVPPVAYTNVPVPTSSTIYRVERALTDRADDAIYTLSITGSPDVRKFRTHDITGKWWVGDASPLGEVFFATSDLSLVVHEPRRGPPVALPPNVVKLLAAIWM